MKDDLKIIYAGDRDISVEVLNFIIEQGVKPKALLVSSKKRATHSDQLKNICKYLDKSLILEGIDFKSERGLEIIKKIKPDYIIGIHFPYIIPKEVLDIPKYGMLNLHPAYLPYNRGWHTMNWAIWEKTPIGATLHYMNEDVDMGDIIHQKELKILPDDTSDSIYKKIKRLEIEVFKESWPSLVSGDHKRIKQDFREGDSHKDKDLLKIQEIKLEESVRADDLIRRLRALTTNSINEAAYFEKDGEKYRVQINIKKEDK